MASVDLSPYIHYDYGKIEATIEYITPDGKEHSLEDHRIYLFTIGRR